MFPNKIALTDEYVDLIIKERKRHGFTAYNLSEKIGKNKSWLANIENHRTKNISKTDLLLIFEDFAKEENLDTEKYIIKYLHPNAMVTLENGNTLPCSILQTHYELLSIDNNPRDYLDSLDFYNGELPFQQDISQLERSLSKFNETILKRVSELSDKKQRQEIIKTFDIMTDSLIREFPLAIEYYKVDIFKKIPSLPYGKYNDFYIKEVTQIIKQVSQQFKLFNAKADVCSYFIEDSDNYYLNYKIANFEHGTINELSEILSDIENYLFSIYNYIQLSYEYTNHPDIDFKKIYTRLKRFLCAFVHIAKLDYKVTFTVPNNDSSEDTIKETQLQANNILFQIKQALQQKYNLKSLPD